MIGKSLGLIDVSSQHLIAETRRHDLVVQAPTDVLVPCAAAARPPRILIGLFVDGAERVNVAVLTKHLIEPRALFGQKTGVLSVRFPVLKVNFFVRNIPVAAKNYLGALTPKLLQVFCERIQAPVFRLLSLIARRSRGQVHRDNIQTLQLHLQVAPLCIKLGISVAADNFFGLVSRVDCDATVALPDGVLIEAVVTRRRITRVR